MLDIKNGYLKYIEKVPSDSSDIIKQYLARGFKVLGQDEDKGLHMYRDVSLEELRRLCPGADVFEVKGKVYVTPWGFHNFTYAVDLRTGKEIFMQDDVLERAGNGL